MGGFIWDFVGIVNIGKVIMHNAAKARKGDPGFQVEARPLQV
jgi:hypothetical protein